MSTQDILLRYVMLLTILQYLNEIVNSKSSIVNSYGFLLRKQGVPAWVSLLQCNYIVQ